MVGIGRGLVIIGMTASAGIRCIIVITVVAGRTVVRNSSMGSDQWIEVIVNGESGRCPTRICGVTGFTGCGQVQRDVTWVGTLGIIIGMTTGAGIGRIVIITVVAGRTVTIAGLSQRRRVGD